MRLPRKLKKGCRTLNGNPRTKWLRKGRAHIVKTLKGMAGIIRAALIGDELLRRATERIIPNVIPSGGIVVPTPPKVGVAQMPTGEMVLNREQVARLKHAIVINPMESVRATISAENLSDVLQRPASDGEKADRILRERTWKHLGKRY